MNPGRILILLAVGLLIGACSETTKPERIDNDLRGQVVDSLGQPVAGATVVLQYAVDLPVGSTFDKPRTTIQFGIPEQGPVTLWISSYCDGDTVRMLLAGELPPGQHEVLWDGQDDAGRTMPDGVYRYHLLTATGRNDQAIVLLYPGYQLPEAASFAPLAVTDANGRFALSQACLPFGFSFDAVNEIGEILGTATVTRSVRVWAYDPRSGALAGSPEVVVDATTGAEVTVVVE
jgi:hypothetical protein